MTISVSNNTPRVSYTVSEGATQTSFTVNFEFFADADLRVFVDNTLKTITTHYTVSGGNGSTGTVTMSVTGASGGSTVVIVRAIALERTTDFPTQGAFNISSLNTELDRIIAIHADVGDTADRGLRLQESDDAVATTLPLKDARKGTVLAFNATTGVPEAGPSISSVTTVATQSANINTLAGISANVTTVAGIQANVTTVAGIASNVTTVAGAISNINALAASDVITDMSLLATSDVIADMALLANADVISDMNTLAVTDVINDINLLATSDIVSDLNTLATSDIISDINTLATSDIVSDLNTLATSDIVSDINTLATSDIVTDLNLLATSDFVSDLNTLATTTNVNNISTVAGISSNISTVAGISSNVTTVAGIQANVTSVAGIASNVTTVANNISGVNSFAERYRVQSGVPSSDNDVGDLVFDTSANTLKVFGSSGFQNAGSSVNGTSARFTYNISGTPTAVTGADANGNTLAYDAGFIDVYLNGVKMLNGTDVTVTSGDTVTFASALANGDLVDIVAFGTFSVANIVSTGALNSGSITSGFGNIDTGSSTITTTGAISGGALSGTSLDLNGGELILDSDNDTSITSDTDDRVDIKVAGSDVVHVTSTGLGVGTNSPSARLDVTSTDSDAVFLRSSQSTTTNVYITNTNATANNTANLFFAPANNVAGSQISSIAIEDFSSSANRTADLTFSTRKDGTMSEVARFDSSGKILLGTSQQRGHMSLQIEGDGSGSTAQGSIFLRRGLSTSSIGGNVGADLGLIQFGDNDGGIYAKIEAKSDASAANNDYPGRLVFSTTADGASSPSERMRIDSSGNLLVGKTSTGDFVTGFEVQPSGAIVLYRSSGVAGLFGRTDAGEILRFSSNSATVGKITTLNGDLNIGTADTGLQFRDSNNVIRPHDVDGAANIDDSIDLGQSAVRFQDMFASGGVTTTSDQNEKQDIASLTDKELKVANKLSALFKTYRWKDRVVEKGDKARTHSGIIAQDIQSAFSAEGLDASKYGLFCSDTWWEKDKEIYDTKEEAPKDATEKTRLAVRYTELFSFIFSSIEARLTALEAK